MICGECANTLPACKGFSNQVFCTIHHWHNGEREDASRCSYFKKKPMTNADRIRSMTDEELAEFMFTANGCPMWVSEYSCKEDKGCAGAKGACWLDWLKQEVTD